ncbi:hypothetical protein B7463_g7380, partial [Scytalidium lignicola]
MTLGRFFQAVPSKEVPRPYAEAAALALRLEFIICGLIPCRGFQYSRRRSDLPFCIGRLGQLGRKQCWQAWQNLVKMYLSIGLTNTDDKLVTISGLSRKFYGQLHSDYYAGLWSMDLRSGLGWQTDEFKLPAVAGADLERTAGQWMLGDIVNSARPAMYGAPTLPWASIDNQIKFQG